MISSWDVSLSERASPHLALLDYAKKSSCFVSRWYSYWPVETEALTRSSHALHPLFSQRAGPMAREDQTQFTSDALYRSSLSRKDKEMSAGRFTRRWHRGPKTFAPGRCSSWSVHSQQNRTEQNRANINKNLPEIYHYLAKDVAGKYTICTCSFTPQCLIIYRVSPLVLHSEQYS